METLTAPAVFWPAVLGLTFLAIGILTWRRDLLETNASAGVALVALGPTFIAASLATFAGEHFTAAKTLVELVPKWFPARVFITYFVGVAHLAAAMSLVTHRLIRWSSIFLAIMFALFVALLWLPRAVKHPEVRILWIVAARETTFAVGGFSLFGNQISQRSPKGSRYLAAVARIWTGFVLAFFGIDHLLHPQYSPGVPDTQPTAAWVPLPLLLAYLTGFLLIACGIAMFVRRSATPAGALAGLLMLVLTVVLYGPQLFLAHGVSQAVTAINFVADTLLFSGTLLVITAAIDGPGLHHFFFRSLLVEERAPIR